MRTKVFFDIETTGLDEEKDEIHQLSAKCGKEEINYYIRFKVVPSHNLYIPYNIRRVTLEDAILGLYDFITKMSSKHDPMVYDPKEEKEKRQGLIFAGKNPLFDWKFLMKQKLFQESWEKYFHYNLFDLTTIIYFLKDLGIIPNEQSTKLEELVKYFELKIKGEPHDSLFDTIATYEIYQLCIKMKKGKSKGKTEKDKKEEIRKIITKWYPNFSDEEIIDALNSGIPPPMLKKPVKKKVK